MKLAIKAYCPVKGAAGDRQQVASQRLDSLAAMQHTLARAHFHTENYIPSSVNVKALPYAHMTGSGMRIPDGRVKTGQCFCFGCVLCSGTAVMLSSEGPEWDQVAEWGALHRASTPARKASASHPDDFINVMQFWKVPASR